MNQADTAWMLISTALVLLMTPALAFFYGGLVRSKNALNTMMMSFISLGFVGVIWAAVGYSLALTPGSNFLGDLSAAFLNGVGLENTGSIIGDRSFHQGRSGQRCRPPMPVMDSWLMAIRATLSAKPRARRRGPDPR